MRAQILQHVPFEGPGSIADWLDRNGAAVARTNLWRGTSFPVLDGIDLVIVLGGPMSVNDEARHPWLADEKRLIREAVERGIGVLGVCLGAQLIAAAMGARVYPNPEKEIGWFPLISGRDAGRSVFRFPPSFMAFHWHGETFDIPNGAVPLARSEGCENQAFQLGDRTIGLQFHLETTPGGVRDMITHCGAELAPSRYVQSAEDILAIPAATFEALHALMNDVLNHVTSEQTPQLPRMCVT